MPRGAGLPKPAPPVSSRVIVSRKKLRYSLREEAFGRLRFDSSSVVSIRAAIHQFHREAAWNRSWPRRGCFPVVRKISPSLPMGTGDPAVFCQGIEAIADASTCDDALAISLYHFTKRRVSLASYTRRLCAQR